MFDIYKIPRFSFCASTMMQLSVVDVAIVSVKENEKVQHNWLYP